jgi:hypothetical protein
MGNGADRGTVEDIRKGCSKGSGPCYRYGSPVMSTVTLPLSAAVQHLPLPEEMLEIKETVSVSPNKQRTCRIKCWYKYYGVWFNIYASHPVTGEKRILKGILDIYYPQSYEIESGEETDLY